MGLFCEYAVVLTYLKMLTPAPFITIIRPVWTVNSIAEQNKTKNIRTSQRHAYRQERFFKVFFIETCQNVVVSNTRFEN